MQQMKKWKCSQRHEIIGFKLISFSKPHSHICFTSLFKKKKKKKLNHLLHWLKMPIQAVSNYSNLLLLFLSYTVDNAPQAIKQDSIVEIYENL